MPECFTYFLRERSWEEPDLASGMPHGHRVGVVGVCRLRNQGNVALPSITAPERASQRLFVVRNPGDSVLLPSLKGDEGLIRRRRPPVLWYAKRTKESHGSRLGHSPVAVRTFEVP